MKIHEVEERIKKVIHEHLDIPLDVVIDSNDEEFLMKYNLNSVDALELLLIVEKEFDIEIDDADLNSDLLSTIHNLAVYVLDMSEED